MGRFLLKKQKKEAKRQEYGTFGSALKNYEKTSIFSVNKSNTPNKGPHSFAKVVFFMLFVVLFMFFVMDKVQEYGNQKILTEIKLMLEECKNEEKKLMAELDEYYSIEDLSKEASGEFGMASGEGHKKVYVDVSEDETIDTYETETKDYGAIATIMNALGNSASNWIDVISKELFGNN